MLEGLAVAGFLSLTIGLIAYFVEPKVKENEIKHNIPKQLKKL